MNHKVSSVRQRGKVHGQVRGSIRARQFFAPAPRKAAANKKPPHVPVYTTRFVTWPPTPSSIARHDALTHLLTAWNIRREARRRNSEYSRYFYIEERIAIGDSNWADHDKSTLSAMRAQYGGLIGENWNYLSFLMSR